MPPSLVRVLTRRIAPVAALLLYAGLAFYQMDLPGFYYDEALDLPPALQLAQGRPVVLMPTDPGVSLVGLTLPTMILDYLGTVNTYLTLPFFVVIGASWMIVRWVQIAIGLVIVALSYSLARMWFGAPVAALAALLVAVNPSFIFWSRMGFSVTSVMNVCALGSLIVITRWLHHHDDRRWAWAGLWLGLGLWAKFLFLWWINALAAVYVLLRWRGWWPGPWRAWAWGMLGFIVGAAPLLYYNLRTGQTYTLLVDALRSPTAYGVNNANVIENLRAAWEQFRIFLDGSYFWYNGEIQQNPWAFGIFLLSLAIVIALLWRRPPSPPAARRASSSEGEQFGGAAMRGANRRRRALVVAIIIAAIVVQSAFTVSGIWATHLFILVPFVQIIVALAAVSVWRAARARSTLLRSVAAGFSALLLFGVFAGDLGATVHYHAELARTGGYGRFSDAIYALADHLDQNGLSAPAALDWGLEKNLLILTNGRVEPVEIFGYSAEPDEGFRERVLASLCDGCAFITVDPRYAVFPREAAFRALVAEAGYTISEDETFVSRERSGQIAYLVYRVRPAR